jgi:hypothetical protein
MSLNALPIFFITAASALAVGFGVWLLKNFFSEGGVWDLIFAVLSFAVSVGLILYERYFLKKTKKVSLL